jgi:signal transduction histidine kinase
MHLSGAKMSTQPRRVLSDTLESDLLARRRERLKFTVHHSGPILLAGGFGILVLLIFITGLGIVSRATLLFSEVSTIDTNFRQLSLDLERLRSDVFLAGSYVRDQLFDVDSDSIEDRLDRFLKARSIVENRLIAISQNVSPEQRTEFGQVRMEIEAYWKAAEPVFNDKDGETRSVRSLQRELYLRRNSVLNIVATIGSINEGAVEQRQHEIETAENDLVQYTRRMILVSSLLGLIVAIAAGYGNHLLQKLADQQQRRTERAERELRSLSTQLVHAQEHERRTISRELHDEVGQTLTGLGIELANLEHLREGAQSEFRCHLDDAKRLTEETLRTVRNMAMGLRPSMLDDSGIVPAVRWQASELSRRTGTPVELKIEGDFDGLGDERRTCLYRVVQEALTNCARHAAANTIQITMQGKKESVALSIRDDGVGFDTVRARTSLGLVGIEERVKGLGGSLAVRSWPSQGTLVHVEIPLATTAAK